MKLLSILLASLLLQIDQPKTGQPQLKNKIWYCAKYTSMGDMKKIDRLNPVFRFGISFINPANKAGQHYTRFNNDGVITGIWSLSGSKLTLSPDDSSNYPVETYEVIASGDSNFMTLREKTVGNKFYMVLGD